jgi:hypothetical protein
MQNNTKKATRIVFKLPRKVVIPFVVLKTKILNRAMRHDFDKAAEAEGLFEKRRVQKT